MQQGLVKMIQQRTGLDEAMAQQVATTVIDFLKTKLRPEVALMLAGGSPDVSTDGGLLGGPFGGRPG